MNGMIVKSNPIRIVGFKTDLKERMEDNLKIIPAFWEKTLGSKQYGQMCDLESQSPQGILGVSVYIDPQHIYYYIATATNQPIPDQMAELEIPAATWCIVKSDGCSSSFEDMFKYFLMEWLPTSGYDYAELPDIEVYPVESLSHFPKEIWFGIKKD